VRVCRPVHCRSEGVNVLILDRAQCGVHKSAVPKLGVIGIDSEVSEKKGLAARLIASAVGLYPSALA